MVVHSSHSFCRNLSASGPDARQEDERAFAMMYSTTECGYAATDTQPNPDLAEDGHTQRGLSRDKSARWPS